MPDTTTTGSKVVWKTLERFSGYKVSSNGQITTKSGDRILKSWNSHGYNVVQLHGNGFMKRVRVHRLVGEAFLGPCPKWGFQINHKNCITTDNRVENLEWRDAKGNMKHYYDELRKSGIKPKKQKIGIQNVKTGESHTFESIGEASRFFNINDSTMCSNAIDYHNNGKVYKGEWLIYKLDENYEICKTAYPTKEYLTMGASASTITQ